MKRRDVLIALAWSVMLGLVIGGGFAAYDWQLNPGGIFRGPDGTNWQFMFDTAFSWFMPIVLWTFPLILVITWGVRAIRIRARRQ
jgi:ABC-type dipeptide/oligopeptide/nickel transport system permease component